VDSSSGNVTEESLSDVVAHQQQQTIIVPDLFKKLKPNKRVQKPSKLKLKQRASTKLPPAITPHSGVEAAINNSLVPIVATSSAPRSFEITVPVVASPLAKKSRVFVNATSLPRIPFVEKPFKPVKPRK
jgi:hypothetical protein